MPGKPSRLSRREFLRLSAIGVGTLAGGRLLSACSPALTAAAATPTLPPATPTPTLNPTNAAILAGRPLPEIIKFFPDAKSKVIRTHHTGVRSGKDLIEAAIRLMLDASITKLTGINDSKSAWSALFKPGEKIAIKVNAFRNSLIWTHVPLVMEVTKSLVEAGIPAEDITIFDYLTTELKTASFPVNADGAGVRCAGMDSNYAAETTDVNGAPIKLANILKNADAVINIPILKSHMLSGISFAMKNHYGSIYYPDILHGNGMRAIAALNAIPEIKNRTRLIIGDALSANLQYANYYPYWQEDWTGDSIFMSFDPVAHDAMGLQLLTTELDKIGAMTAGVTAMSKASMEYAVELGLGTNDHANIDMIEQTLS